MDSDLAPVGGSEKSVTETPPPISSGVDSRDTAIDSEQMPEQLEDVSLDINVHVTEVPSESADNVLDSTQSNDINRRSSRIRQLSHNAAESKATELSVKLLKVISKGTKDMNNALQNLDSVNEFDVLHDLINTLQGASEQVQTDISVLQEVTKNKINPTINQTCNDFTTEIAGALDLVQDKITAIETHQRNHDQQMEMEMEEQLRIINQEMNNCQAQRRKLTAKGKQPLHQPRYQPQASGSEITIKSSPSTPAYQRSEALLLETSDATIGYSKEIVTENGRPISPTPSTTSEASIRQLADCLAQTIKATKKTNIEPSVFSGDAMEFTEWEQDLDNYMESVGIVKPTEKMRYLKKYISGDAREVISGQLFFQTEDAYLHARKKLRERFGNQFNIARTMREKLNSWPKIMLGDGIGLRKFSDYLDHCSSGMRSIGELAILNDPLINEQLANKLPDWAKRKWAGKVFSSKKIEHRYPTFTDFANFVAEEAEIMAEPILYQHGRSPRPATPKPQLSDSSKSNWRTLTTTHQPAYQFCHYCPESKRDSHSSAHCGVLAEQPYDDRIKFIQNNSLCYGCLKAGHSWDNCTDRQGCFKCKSTRHPTCLHKRKQDWDNTRTATAPTTPTHQQNQSQLQGNVSTSTTDRNEKQTVVSTKTTNIHTDQLLSMILPVYISTQDNPNQEILVYALIDSQSDCSYVTKEVAEVLKPKGNEISVTINTMTGTVDMKKLTMYEDLSVRGYRESESISLSALEWDTISCNRDQIPHCGNIGQYPHLKGHMDKLPPLMDIPIGLLIGRDSPDAHFPLEVIKSDQKGLPFAAKTILGWYVLGGGTGTNKESVYTKMTTASVLADMDETRIISQDDIKFLEILENEMERTPDGYIVLPLPFKERPYLHNNRTQAIKRLQGLSRKFKTDPDYKRQYSEFMNELIAKGHAEPAPGNGNHGEVWYIPHFAVRHPKKDKLRVVYDCSAQFNGKSLNETLLQGPDMLNSLVGILCRFRKEPIALSCDVEKMFYNFYVANRDRDYLRFLWFDQQGHITDYRMTVHLFGATSSPAVATYGLRQLAKDNEHNYPTAAEFVTRNFYVDDGIISVATVKEAKTLIADARNLCSHGKLRLHKFVCNNREVMDSVPPSEMSKDIDLFKDHTPNQRTLGLEWDVETDQLRFNSSVISEKPQTRRGLLSVVSQIFDPLGLLTPFTLVGKQILQEANRSSLGWDKTIPLEIQSRWQTWLQQLQSLDCITVPRCIKPPAFGKIVHSGLHHFSDASLNGIGSCSYLRLRNETGMIHTSLLMAKSRVIPTKGVVTVPRLELQGAILATRVSKILQGELDLNVDEEHYWTDSTIVLGYISNDSKRFQVYVANRVREIREHSNPSQWHHVPGEANPADTASRGARCDSLQGCGWFSGPEFLKSELSLKDALAQDKQVLRTLEDDDPETKKVKQTQKTIAKQHRDIYSRFANYSEYHTLNRSIAYLKCMVKNRTFKVKGVTSEDIEAAEQFVIRTSQKHYFQEEITKLQSDGKLNKNSKLRNLDPRVDANGILHVGGRSNKSSVLSHKEKHPIIIPKESHIAQLIVRHYHNKVHHQGRVFTVAAVRTAGFWIVGLQGLARAQLNKCITCNKIRKTPNSQKMGLLPKERLEPAPPFTSVGVDCFGHFTVKDRRTECKRWGLIFSCMYSRAVHIELLESMSTDAFLNALRSFICLRGPVKVLYCDNGTNFVGANNELSREIHLTQDQNLRRFFSENMIEFKFNAPCASHTGGAWERSIRTARSILNGMTALYKGRLDTPTLRTAMYEVMATINSSPLTSKQLDNPYEEVITPNHLLTMKANYTAPPPGQFVESEIYRQKMWRRAQQLAEQFWKEWKNSYLQDITKRQKWQQSERNIMVGDIVLVVDDEKARNDWSTGTVEEVRLGADGLVRRAKVKMANRYLDRKGKPMFEPSHLERAVQKLVLLVPGSD